MERCSILALLSAAVLIMSCLGVEGWSSYNTEVFQVGGKVMCQDCSKDWNQWAHGAVPIQGSKVAVTCMDARARVVYHTSDLADAEGEFDLSVTKNVDGIEIDPEHCTVRLVSSGSATCNLMTDFGGGKSGVSLHRPTQVYPGVIKYTVGPFYFTTPQCDLPDNGPQ
ncbi:pistil-specific extensin-like protein [Typha latifolia]|uniref:pistil-specific extensin-like protein n=1 Tax=Typha latifolia TaxID=4733 RepID=UPI003C2B4E63